jgi:hypothetical protein
MGRSGKKPNRNDSLQKANKQRQLLDASAKKRGLSRHRVKEESDGEISEIVGEESSDGSISDDEDFFQEDFDELDNIGDITFSHVWDEIDVVSSIIAPAPAAPAASALRQLR